MYKYKKEIENLIYSVKKPDNNYFKSQKNIKVNENNATMLQNKLDKINRDKQLKKNK